MSSAAAKFCKQKKFNIFPQFISPIKKEDKNSIVAVTFGIYVFANKFVHAVCQILAFETLKN